MIAHLLCKNCSSWVGATYDIGLGEMCFPCHITETEKRTERIKAATDALLEEAAILRKLAALLAEKGSK